MIGTWADLGGVSALHLDLSSCLSILSVFGCRTFILRARFLLLSSPRSFAGTRQIRAASFLFQDPFPSVLLHPLRQTWPPPWLPPVHGLATQHSRRKPRNALASSVLLLSARVDHSLLRPSGATSRPSRADLPRSFSRFRLITRSFCCYTTLLAQPLPRLRPCTYIGTSALLLVETLSALGSYSPSPAQCHQLLLSDPSTDAGRSHCNERARVARLDSPRRTDLASTPFSPCRTACR